MEALVLIGGFLLVAGAGYVAAGRLGRFLEHDGISPYWDEGEESAAKGENKTRARTDAQKAQNGCGAPESDI